MQEKLLRLLRCWSIILGRISCEAWTGVWVPLSHTASGKERVDEVHFLPSLSFSFDSCSGKHVGLHRREGLKQQRGLVKHSQVPQACVNKQNFC